MIKELCECGKIAIWCYMPGYSSGCSPYFCDECVHRGCDCHNRYMDTEDPLFEPPEGQEGIDWKWVEEGRIWVSVDDKGREWPCSEYDWETNGYERENNPHII